MAENILRQTSEITRERPGQNLLLKKEDKKNEKKKEEACHVM